MFRIHKKVPEVLLIHPGKSYRANKDLHAWSKPKGEIGESGLQHSGAVVSCPEVVKVQCFLIEQVIVKEEKGQIPIMEQLETKVSKWVSMN